MRALSALAFLVVFCLAGPYVAHGKSATGTIRQIVADYIDPDTGAITGGTSTFELVRGRRRTPLADDPSGRYIGGAKMRVSGYYDARGRLVPDPGVKGVKLKKKPPLTPAPATGHLVVVPMSFVDFPIQHTSQEIADTFNSETIAWPTHRGFFADASYGRFDLKVTVLPIQHSPFRANDIACDIGLAVQEALRLIDWQVIYTDTDVSFIDVIIPNEYDDHGNVLFCPDLPDHPERSTIGWAGLGYVGHGEGITPQGWMDLSGQMEKESHPSIPHETGHNLGLEHANSLECGQQVVGFPANLNACHNQEYGDRYDTMGSIGDFNAIHKRQLGWLHGSGHGQVYDTIQAAPSFPYIGTWHLSPMSEPQVDETARTTTGVPDVKALWLPLQTNPPSWLTLEARYGTKNDRVWGWLTNNDDSVLAGVIAHTTLSPGVLLPSGQPPPAAPYNAVSDHGGWLLWLQPSNDTNGGHHTGDAILRVGQSLVFYPWKVTVTKRDVVKRWTDVQIDDVRWFGAACPAAPAQCPPSPYTGEIGTCHRGQCCYHKPGLYFCEQTSP